MQLKFALALCFPQKVQELASEYTAQDFHWQEEAISGVDPACVIERQATAGNHAVEMRMMPSSSTIP